MPPTSTVTPLPLIIAVAATLTFAACSATPASDAAHAANLAAAPAIDSAQNEAAARHAKVAYLAGINSNDLEQFLATISDDVVYVAPNAAAIVGKEAVTAWVRDYMAAYHTRWEKETKEFVVRGDLAFEHYRYHSVDTPRADGPAKGTPVVADSGNGFNIYRRGADGAWKLARDAWATERPLPPAGQ